MTQLTTRQRRHDFTGTGDLKNGLVYALAPGGGFEAPALAAGTYQYTPTGSAWTFSGGAGLSRNGSAFTSGNPGAPEGNQVAFLQNTGSFSQSVTLSAGTYAVTFKAAKRGNFGGTQTIQVLVDGNSVGTFTPTVTSYQDFTTATFTVADGSHTLTFQGMTSTGDNTDFVDKVQIGSAASRPSYAGYYYDAANRLTVAVDVGTNAGAAWTRPGTVPARSDSALVTDYAYDAAGRLASVTDPRNITTKTYYDALGRTTQTVEAYDTGSTDDQHNKTTDYAYDGAGHLVSLTARLPGGNQQTTAYVYGVSAASGSAIASNDLLLRVEHPDPSSGAAVTDPNAHQWDVYTYNALGETLTTTDRIGSAGEKWCQFAR